MRLSVRAVIAWACLGLSLALAARAAAQSQTQNRIYQTPPGLGQFPYSDADIEFMSGMIPHHAQAVIMAGWAPTHGARKEIAILCERIVVAQRDASVEDPSQDDLFAIRG